MRGLLIAAAVTLTLAAAPAMAARPGTLDRGFGKKGRVETSVPGGLPAVAGLKMLVGGRPLLVGTVGKRTVVLLRYHRAGLPDRGFGERGVVSLDLGADVSLGGVAFLRGGSAFVGDALIAGGLGPEHTPDRVAFIAKLTSDGALDPSFGEGGIVRTDFGGDSGDTVTDLAVGRAGRIVATVDTGDGIGVARYDSRGVLDPSFGEGGIARFAPPDSTRSLIPRAVALQGGRILIGGTDESLSGLAPFVLRLLADGTPDPRFGQVEGRFYLPGEASVRDLALEPVSGDILLAGANHRYYPAFYLAELPPDPRVDDTARVTYVGVRAWGDSLALDGSGRRIIGGSLRRRGEPPSFGVARVLPDGQIDRCFGKRGLARIGFRGGSPTLAATDLDGRGRIVAVGPTDYSLGAPRARSFKLVRLWGGDSGRGCA